MGNITNIYDIAKEANVSIATVSRVLSGGANVSAATQKRVRDVIETLQYTPNAFARGLGLGTMRMAGILCTDVSDIFYAKMVSDVERLLRLEGLDALLCCTGESLEGKKKGLRFLARKHVDAVLLIGSAFREQSDNSYIEAMAARVPVIVINGLIECPNTYCVLCDEEAAIYNTAGALLRQGARRILYLYDILTYSGAHKLAGYRRAMRESEEPFALRCEKSLEAAYAAVRCALDAEKPFDAVIASEDLLAVGALHALQDRGICLPVVGFNNSILAQCTTPALTSIDNMAETLCTTACGILRDVLDGKLSAAKVLLSAQLIQRETFKIDKNQEEQR